MGSLQYTYNIVVEKSPILIDTPIINQTINIGENILLYCAVEGDPDPLITWFKGNKLLANSSTIYGKINKKMFLSMNKQLLRIVNTEFDSFGEYNCKAENHLGTAQRKFIITFTPYWGEWSAFSVCSKACGKGLQVRMRFCRKMEKYQKNVHCIGKDTETKVCVRRQCIPNEWSEWSDFSAWYIEISYE